MPLLLERGEITRNAIERRVPQKHDVGSDGVHERSVVADQHDRGRRRFGAATSRSRRMREQRRL